MVRGALASPVIAYETWGRLNDRTDNAVLLFTGLSPSAHAASSYTDPSTGWWEDMVGPSKPIDTNRYFVVCINSLGSCFGSTGPASENPDTGEIYKLNFPVLSLEDIARAGQAVTASLGIKRLHAVVGVVNGRDDGTCFYPVVSRPGGKSGGYFLGREKLAVFDSAPLVATRTDP